MTLEREQEMAEAIARAEAEDVEEEDARLGYVAADRDALVQRLDEMCNTIDWEGVGHLLQERFEQVPPELEYVAELARFHLRLFEKTARALCVEVGVRYDR